jgi:prevent-host-death family protein
MIIVEVIVMQANATEVQNNFGKYLKIADQEDVIITRNGKQIARLTGLERDRIFLTESLVGILPQDVDEKAERAERVERLESDN